MKTKVTILLFLFGLSFGTSAYAQWWKDLGRDLLGAIGAAVTTNTVQKYGGEEYQDREKAEQFTRDLYDFIGANKKNAEIGIAWNNAETSYQKQNIVANAAFDIASKNSKNPQYVELIRQATTTEINYLDDKFKATNENERREALSKKALSWVDIGYSAYQIGEENKKAAAAARRLEMEEQLKGLRGVSYSDNDVISSASYIIATVQSNELSESEKENYISQLGLKQSPKEIISIVKPLLDEDNDAELRRQEELKRQREAEERRIAEEKRQAEIKVAEERRNALQKLGTIRIDSYAFDETNLSKKQKTELDEAVVILNKYSDVNVLLTGHTCKIGYKNINQRKGMKRAEAAKDYLMSKGVSENRITIESKGETEPLVPNISTENFKQNRRVEIQVK